jgi:hypothetical protein
MTKKESKEPPMPTWTLDTGTHVYRHWLGDKEITAAEFKRLDDIHTAWKKENPATNDNVPFVKPPPDAGWEYLNDGRGLEATQFAGNKFKPGDPRNKRYFRSQREMIETARREGYHVEKLR